MLDLFQFEFMQRALIAGLIVAFVCPMVGMFIVIRRQSLLGDGLGHIAFAGVTGASLLGMYPPLGAAILTVGAAVGIEYLRRKHLQYTDMSLALFFYTGLALAVIFCTMAKIPGTALMSFLFGSILTVTFYDIINIGVVACVVSIMTVLLLPKLLLASFDEEVAKVAGINTNRINMIFAVITALVVVIGMSIVGILLISALMIIPVAAAHLWKCSFRCTMGISIVYSFFAVAAGLLAAASFDLAPGGTIVLSAIIVYIFTFAGTAIMQS